MLAGAVHQGVGVYPANAGGIRPQLWFGGIGQLPGYLAQVFQYPGTSPVQVGVVIEDHIHIGVAKEGIPPNRFGARHRQHGGGERVGHLVFHHLGRLARIRGLDDHLYIRQVRYGVNGRFPDGIESPPNQYEGGEQYKKSVMKRPLDNAVNHELSPVW